MSTWLMLGLGFRVLIIVLGFIAIWSLWEAKERRQHLWTPKMKDIWVCHILFVGCAVEANIELFYRQVMPTFAAVVVAYILYRTTKGSFNGEKYTIDQE